MHVQTNFEILILILKADNEIAKKSFFFSIRPKIWYFRPTAFTHTFYGTNMYKMEINYSYCEPLRITQKQVYKKVWAEHKNALMQDTFCSNVDPDTYPVGQQHKCFHSAEMLESKMSKQW